MQRIPVLLLLMLFCSGLMFGQYSLTASAMDQTTLDFTQIANLKNSSAISGQIQFFTAHITKPAGKENEALRLYGKLGWVDVDGTSYENMAEFLTEPFTLNDINNQQFGTVIPIADTKSNSNAIDKNIAKGKLVGTYNLTFRLYHATDPNRIGRLASVPSLADYPTSFTIQNPTQTISIIDPVFGDSKNVTENVSISWTQVDGIPGKKNDAYYWIRANKILAGETPDGALSKGNLYVDSKLTGNPSTSTNWQTIKRKDWSIGDNVVVVVSAIFPDGLELKSAPVVFSVSGNAGGADTTHHNEPGGQISPFNQALIGIFATLPLNISSLIPQSFLQSLTNGQLVINDITLDGVTFSLGQLQSLMQVLAANPSRIQSLTLNPR